VEEKRLPSMLLSILLSEVEALMGRRSLITLLRQAGLSDYIDYPLPMDDAPTITISQYSKLLASIFDIFGTRSAHQIFVQSGRLAAAQSRKQRGTRFALTGTALRFLGGSKRMQIVLDRLAEQGTETFGAPHRFEEREDAFYFEIEQCPYCAEISPSSKPRNRPLSRPVCYIPAAMIDEMVEWATGQRHLVEEVTCMVEGAAACRFRVGK
jgi:hypothetical protein